MLQRRLKSQAEPVEEIWEDRFVNILLPQSGEIRNLDFGTTAAGTFLTKRRPLTLAARFGDGGQKKKRS